MAEEVDRMAHTSDQASVSIPRIVRRAVDAANRRGDDGATADGEALAQDAAEAAG